MFRPPDNSARTTSRHRRFRRGSATLELALLLPVLIGLGLLCVDFGRFAHTYIAVTNAARAGASYAIMHPVAPETKAVWDAAIRQAVINELSSNSWFSSSSLIMPSPTATHEGNGYWRVQVDVSYPFQTAVNWQGLGMTNYHNVRNLRRVVVMRAIR